MSGFTTRAIHGALSRSEANGSLRTPLFDTAAFEFSSSEDLRLAFEGRKPAHTYSRLTNPTVTDFENRIKLLTDSFGVIAVSSGMAAISNAVLALVKSNTNIVTSKFLFGHTFSFFSDTLKRFGVEVRYVNLLNLDEVSSAIDEKTALLFLETITNPQLEIADISKLTKISQEKNIPVVLDNTCATPYLLNTKSFGVAVEVLSSTKYMSGGGTSIGGLIIDNGIFDWRKLPIFYDISKKVGPASFIVRLRKEIYRNLGSCMAPHNAYLQTLGLETMALRIEKSCANALAVAQLLEKNNNCIKVNYPGLESSQFYQIANTQFENRFGGILTFQLKDRTTCFKFMDSLKLIRKATNIHDNKSLIIHPSSTIFCDFTEEEKVKMMVYDNLIRMSVGIEDTKDIIDDLQNGFSAIEKI